MDFQICLSRELFPAAADVLRYLGVHLQSTDEVGNLAQVKGYLNHQGQVAPLLDRSIWRRLGWAGSEQPPEKVIAQLCAGMDVNGKSLTRSKRLHMPPKEFVLTLPSELSEALRNNPEAAHDLLRSAVETFIRCAEEHALRMREGRGRETSPSWHPGRLSWLAYLHAENRAGEPHFHAHVLIFGPALDKKGEWRVWDSGALLKRLNGPGGARQAVTSAVMVQANYHGYRVRVTRGLAGDPRTHGAHVTLPDGRVIGPGSVRRTRREEILAAEELRRCIGAPPFTPSELELIRRSTGRFPAHLRGVKRRDILEKKLRALGLLDYEGAIVSSADLQAGLTRMAQGMAEAQAALRDRAAPREVEAAALIEVRRQTLAQVAPEIDSSTSLARIRWTTQYERLLRLIASAPDGLRTDGWTREQKNLASKLKRAGYLSGIKTGVNMIYSLTPQASARLAKGEAEQATLEAALHELLEYEADLPVPAEQRLGRLECSGFELDRQSGLLVAPKAGRTCDVRHRLEELGISTSMDSTPDIRFWNRLRHLKDAVPAVLRPGLLPPEEVAARWPNHPEVRAWLKLLRQTDDDQAALESRLQELREELIRLEYSPHRLGQLERLTPSRTSLPAIRLESGGILDMSLRARTPSQLHFPVQTIYEHSLAGPYGQRIDGCLEHRLYLEEHCRREADREARQIYGLILREWPLTEGFLQPGHVLELDGVRRLVEIASEMLVAEASLRAKSTGYEIPYHLRHLRPRVVERIPSATAPRSFAPYGPPCLEPVNTPIRPGGRSRKK